MYSWMREIKPWMGRQPCHANVAEPRYRRDTCWDKKTSNRALYFRITREMVVAEYERVVREWHVTEHMSKYKEGCIQGLSDSWREKGQVDVRMLRVMSVNTNTDPGPRPIPTPPNLHPADKAAIDSHNPTYHNFNRPIVQKTGTGLVNTMTNMLITDYKTDSDNVGILLNADKKTAFVNQGVENMLDG
ncbi:MAG: hypothetical protein Q9218_003748 [Villophora microphyllina]